MRCVQIDLLTHSQYIYHYNSHYSPLGISPYHHTTRRWILNANAVTLQSGGFLSSTCESMNELNTDKSWMMIILELRRVRVQERELAQLFFDDVHYMTRHYQILQVNNATSSKQDTPRQHSWKTVLGWWNTVSKFYKNSAYITQNYATEIKKHKQLNQSCYEELRHGE